MKNPLVSVVILNFNGLGYTLKCLDSVRKSVFRDYEVIVVDNGSSDGSVEALKKKKDIRLVVNRSNLGFAEGNNVGTRASKGKYVCLLNNDTIVDRLWLRELVSAIESDPKIAVCNPKFFDKYGSSDYHFNGYGTVGLFQSPVFLPSLRSDTNEYISSLTACGSAFFRRDIIEEPYDADYFAYAEDAQLGWRANLMGYKVIHVPKSVVYHEGAVTAKSMKVPWDYWFVLAERNKMLNMLTLYSWFSLLRLLPYFFANLILANVYDFRHFFSRLKAYWWILSNLRSVLAKRARLQRMRRIGDGEIVRLMSFKVYDERFVRNPLVRFVVSLFNGFFWLYCWLVFFRTVEFHRLKSVNGVIQPV